MKLMKSWHAPLPSATVSLTRDSSSSEGYDAANIIHRCTCYVPTARNPWKKNNMGGGVRPKSMALWALKVLRLISSWFSSKFLKDSTAKSIWPKLLFFFCFRKSLCKIMLHPTTISMDFQQVRTIRCSKPWMKRDFARETILCLLFCYYSRIFCKFVNFHEYVTAKVFLSFFSCTRNWIRNWMLRVHPLSFFYSHATHLVWFLHVTAKHER